MLPRRRRRVLSNPAAPYLVCFFVGPLGHDVRSSLGEGWELEFLNLLKCDSPLCREGSCTCAHESSEFVVYAMNDRVYVDAIMLSFGGLASMIVFLACNIGWLMDRVRSRVLIIWPADTGRGRL